MSRFSTKLQGLLAAAAAIGALAIAAPASAVTLVSATMDTSNTAQLTGSGPTAGYSVYAYIGPVTFHAKNDDLTEYDFTAYCVDVYHDMFLGPLNAPNGYKYHAEDLTTDSKNSTALLQLGNALNNLQLEEIASLLNLSSLITKWNVPNLSAKRAGIQGAIWEIENPTITVTGSALVNQYINKYKIHAAADPLSASEIHSVFADDFGHQAFAFANGVPEPATWTMMILGFGGVGAMLRRRRQAVALA